MIASLGMYDRPETAAANDRFWALIRDALRARDIPAPDALDRKDAFWGAWRSPDLIFSQTCGMPYRLFLHGRVTLVATPDYGLPGCGPGEYGSIFVARRDDPRQSPADFNGATFAFNEAISQSGWASPIQHALDNAIAFGTFLRTGGHRNSAEAVSAGKADIAALDGLTWQLIRRYDGFADGLREIAATKPTPTLPYVTGPRADPGAVLAALRDALEQLPSADRETLGLRGLIEVPAARYLAVPTPPPPPGMQYRADAG